MPRTDYPKAPVLAAVDLILPVHNGAATIEESLISLRLQTLRDLRIIVIDDGSTDDSAAIIEKLAAEDPRIMLVRQENEGIVGALNHGVRLCTAPVIARLDADDIAYPERLAVQLDFLEANPDCVAVGTHARVIDGSGRATGDFARPGPIARADPDDLPATEPYIMHPFLMVRRPALEDIGGYRHCYHSEDTDLYWRLQERGRLENIEAVLGDYRVHSASITGGSLENARLMAFWSQRSALSANRRRRGIPDLEFSEAKVRQSRDCSTMRALWEECTADLRPGEREHLRIASAMKLGQLLRVRRRMPDRQDCLFIRDAQDHAWSRLSRRQRRAVSAEAVALALFLTRYGRPSLARLVLPPRLYVRAAGGVIASVWRRLAAVGATRRASLESVVR